MEIIAAFERASAPLRGALATSDTRAKDVCITIRTIVWLVTASTCRRRGHRADCPSREYEETLSNARALMNAVTIAEEGF
jgi:hypothetical protein